ncbi:MAG TPA: HI0074 family nucleotidyltransferase substrate-binding subunit [Bdellovibrionota bacterium]|nr:HI0074 family nucleotidyltransferase substrate-binding subunit [Bdellovibrionota bacterium]
MGHIVTVVHIVKKKLDVRSQQRFQNFKRALGLYGEALKPKMSKLEEEGLIQRFEYTFELAWKCLQDLLYERGYAEVRGPRPVIEQAFQDGMISDGPLWLQMLKARNETTHLYDEAVFKSISKNVKGPFLSVLKNFEKNFPK